MDTVNWLRFALSFIFVLGLLGLSALALRKWGGKFAVPGMLLPKSSDKRLNVVEVCPLSPRARLVLVRRDNTEHLLALTGESVQVVESGISRNA